MHLVHGRVPAHLRPKRECSTCKCALKTFALRLCWYPCGAKLDNGENATKKRKLLPSSHPDLSVRFVKESSLAKKELMADIDHVDVTARAETMNTVPTQPVMLQVLCAPCVISDSKGPPYICFCHACALSGGSCTCVRADGPCLSST